jgi:hypothetical protein
MADIAPRRRPVRLRGRWAMAIPVVLALLFAVSFGLFGVGAINATPRAAAELASLSGQIAQSTASATKTNLDWQPALGAGPRGPDHICDNCGGHHGGSLNRLLHSLIQVQLVDWTLIFPPTMLIAAHLHGPMIRLPLRGRSQPAAAVPGRQMTFRCRWRR